MKRLILRPHIASLLLVTVLSGCSSSSNTSAPQQANSNSAEQPAVAQNSAPPAPSAPTRTVQPVPAPTDKPAEPPSTEANASPAKPAAAGNARAPKLIVPEKRIEFGKQPQSKMLVRAIAIRNGGRSNLEIESIVPS